MGLFIKLQIDEASCLGVRKCGLCIKVCPVKIFKDNDGRPASIEDNEDECTLCSLCLNECKPNAVRLRKMYEPETESR